MMKADVIPCFFLYGESPRTVGDRFLHVESLDDRSRPSDWNIRPHAHDNLNHVFYIAEGGGEMQVEIEVIAFAAPCLLLVPARVVHGFAYMTETAGSVLTVSEPYLRDLVAREAAFARLFAAASVIPFSNTTLVESSLEQLVRELAWTAPGHAAAVEAVLVRLLVEMLRMSHSADHASASASASAQGAQAGLVARFRELVEASYRTAIPVADYAERLAVTPKQLRAACVKVARAGPVRIVQDRVLLEAKRLMLYSNMTVAEVGYHLGFSDPAYFSRVFSRGAGVPPSTFRVINPER